MTFANSLDPDEAPQNVGSNLRSYRFDPHIVHINIEMLRVNKSEQIQLDILLHSADQLLHTRTQL